MDTAMVVVLVYTHGHSSDGSSDLHSCTLHFGGPGLHHGYCTGGGLDNTTDTPMVGALVYPMDTPLLGVLVYTMDTPMVGVLVYTHGYSNGGDPDLLPWTLQ